MINKIKSHLFKAAFIACLMAMPVEANANTPYFNNITDMPVQEQATSEIIMIPQESDNSQISIKGDGDFRICADIQCQTVLKDWTKKAGEIKAGEFLQLRASASKFFGSTKYIEYNIGDYSNSWKIQYRDSRSCSGPKGEIKHGDYYTAWKAPNVPPGEKCESEVRTCIDGLISGSYIHDTCEPLEDDSCNEKPWGQIKNMSVIIAYKAETVPYGNQCESEARQCKDKILEGTYKFPSCITEAPANCKTKLWGDVPHGESRTAYKFEKPTFEQGFCDIERYGLYKKLKCDNGKFDEDPEYKFKSCTNPEYPRCKSPCGEINHRAGCLAFGDQCGQSEWRICKDGELSGSYMNTESQCKSCELPWGEIITHGSKRLAYMESQSENCKSRVITCDNGKIEGISNNFSHKSCDLISD